MNPTQSISGILQSLKKWIIWHTVHTRVVQFPKSVSFWAGSTIETSLRGIMFKTKYTANTQAQTHKTFQTCIQLFNLIFNKTYSIKYWKKNLVNELKSWSNMQIDSPKNLFKFLFMMWITETWPFSLIWKGKMTRTCLCTLLSSCPHYTSTRRV